MGDIRLGSTDIQALYLGSTALTKVYLGTTEIWSAAPPSTLALDLDFRLNWGEDVNNAINAGPSSLTFSRADTVATGWDENGLLKLARQQNALDYSEDFGQASWILGGNATRQLNTDVAPDGTTTADTITDIGSGYGDVHNTGTVGTTAVCVSVYIKKDTDQTRFPELQLRAANGTMGLYAVQINTETGDTTPRDLGNGSPDAYGTISDGSYWRMWISHANADTTRITWQIHPAVTTSWGAAENAAAGSVVVWGAQLENSSYPQAYTKTEGSAVAVTEIPRFDHDSADQLISGLYRPKGVLIEGAATNNVLYSEDFSQWDQNSNPTLTPGQASPDGANNATLIEDDSTLYESVSFDWSPTADTSSWCFSIFIKKDSDQTRYPGFRMDFPINTGVGRMQINTQTGALTDTGGTPFDDFGVIDCGDWWRVWMVIANTNQSSARIWFYSAHGTVWGTASGNAQGTAIWYGAQLENTAYPTSYIATTTASVTRAAENLYTTDVSWAATDYSGTHVLEFTPVRVITGPDKALMGLGEGGTAGIHILGPRGTTAMRFYGQGSSYSSLSISSGNPTLAISNKTAGALAATNDAELYLNGSSVGTDLSYAFTGGVPSRFDVGGRAASALTLDGHVATAQYYNERRTDGEDLTSLINSPSLHLDFAQNWGSTLESATTVGPQNLLTYTRGDTVATGFDENGVLRRAGTENVCLQSETFDNASWNKSNGTLTANTDTAPDGTTTADQFNDDNASAYGQLRQDITIPNDSTAWCLSCFIKKTSADSHYLAIQPQLTGGTGVSNYVVVDTNTGAITGDTGVTDSGVIDAGDYWRFWVVQTNNGTGNTTLRIIFFPAYNSDGSTTGSTSTTGAKVFWGAQLENTASPNTYVKTEGSSVLAGQPVFDHVYNGSAWEPAGLLVEEARTNVCQGSEEFTAPNWNTSNVTRTADDAVAPDGNTTADHLNETNASALGNVNFITTVSDNSTAWCFSVYVKADDSTDISLRVRIAGGTAVDGSVYYDVSDWSTTTSGAVTAQGTVDIGGGWRRLWVVVTNNSTGNTSLSYYIYPARATEFDTASVGAIWAWGAQLENAASPSSYIATTSSSVTRAKSYCASGRLGVDSGVGFANRDLTGTWFSECRFGANFDMSSPDQYVFHWGKNTTRPRSGIFYDSDGPHLEAVFDAYSGANIITPPALGSVGNLTSIKVAMAVAEDDAEIYVDGSQRLTDSAVDTARLEDDPSFVLNIGSDRNTGGNHLNGQIKDLRYWRQRLPAADLQTLTE